MLVKLGLLRDLFNTHAHSFATCNTNYLYMQSCCTPFTPALACILFGFEQRWLCLQFLSFVVVFPQFSEYFPRLPYFFFYTSWKTPFTRTDPHACAWLKDVCSVST